MGMRKIIIIGFFMLVVILAAVFPVGATNFSYTTINSMRWNDTVPVPNGWIYGNVSVYLTEGLEIVTYTESSDGLQVVLGIDPALLPDLGGTYLKVDASNDPVTGSLEVDEAVVAYKLKLVDDGGSGVDGEIEHVAGDITTDHTYTWPAPPGSTLYLKVDSSGVISFGTPTGTAGGSDGQIQVNDGGNFAGIADGTAGYLLTTDGSANYTWVAPVVDTDTNDKVKITANDTTASWLYDKVTAGTGMSIAEIGDGGDEDLQITCTVVDTDTDTNDKVKVTSNDTTADYLYSKLAAGTGISLVETNDGGDEDVTVTCTVTDTDTNDKVKVAVTDTTADYLMNQLTALTGFTWTQRGTGGDETLEGSVTADFSVISANDVSTDVAAPELEELTDGSDTTLHGHDVTGLTNWPSIDYTYVSGIDANTDVTGAELEELSDGSSTTLHTHSWLPGSISSGFFGPGTDGDVTISADTHLARDMYYDDLTIDSTKILYTDGFRIFVMGTLTNNGTITNSGQDGGNGGNAAGVTGGTAGAAPSAPTTADGYLSEELRGVAGRTGANGTLGGAGTNGTVGNGGTTTDVGKPTYVLSTSNVAGSAGGNGGAVTGFSGGTGGIAGIKGAGVIIPATVGGIYPYNLWQQVQARLFEITGTVARWTFSIGNGGGGSGASGGCVIDPGASSGGGGGSGGNGSNAGQMVIAATTLINNGVISCNGGNGGNGGNGANGTSGAGSKQAGGGGGGAGGDGGNGNTLVVIYCNKSGAGTMTATKGIGGTAGIKGNGVNGGANGTDGTAGADGIDGVVLEYDLAA